MLLSVTEYWHRELSQAVKIGLSKVPKRKWHPVTTMSMGAVLTITDASCNNHSVSRTAMIALLPRRHRALTQDGGLS